MNVPIWLTIIWAVQVILLIKNITSKKEDIDSLYEKTADTPEEAVDFAMRIAESLTTGLTLFIIAYYIISAYFVRTQWFMILSAVLSLYTLYSLIAAKNRLRKATFEEGMSDSDFRKERIESFISLPFSAFHTIYFGYFAFLSHL